MTQTLFRAIGLPVLAAALLVGCAHPQPSQPNLAHPQPQQRHVNGSEPISFGKTIIDVPTGEQLGKFYGGVFHVPLVSYTWTAGTTIGAAAFKQQADDELRESGFAVVGDTTELFESETPSRARYQLGATIRNISLNGYDRMAGNFTESTVQVEWQLYDSFTRKVVFKDSNSGYGWQGGNGGGVVTRAFRNALRAEVAESQLASLVATTANQVPSSSFTNLLAITGVKPSQPLALPGDMDKILDGVVILRAGQVTGCGIIVSPDGYVVTSAHLVSGTKEAAVVLKSGLELSGSVVRIDEAQDLALLKIPGQGHHALELALDGPTPVGSEVYAIGAPLGEKLSYSVTKGVVSGYREFDYANFLQTDASISPGNSGGPLVDKSGRVVGIVSWKLFGNSVQGLSFAVPTSLLSKTLGLTLTAP